MEEKSFRVEMATENAPRGRFYFANLDLPAKDYEILDAHQRARSFTAVAGYQDTIVPTFTENQHTVIKAMLIFHQLSGRLADKTIVFIQMLAEIHILRNRKFQIEIYNTGFRGSLRFIAAKIGKYCSHRCASYMDIEPI